MSAPTFVLPACPVCSHPSALERPYWHHAARTTAKTGKRHVMWVGCKHAQSLRATYPISADSPEVATAEAAWTAEVNKLFTVRTAGWDGVRREKFRREIVGRAFLPGTTETLNLSPAETPAQQSNETEKQ